MVLRTVVKQTLIVVVQTPVHDVPVPAPLIVLHVLPLSLLSSHLVIDPFCPVLVYVNDPVAMPGQIGVVPPLKLPAAEALLNVIAPVLVVVGHEPLLFKAN